MPDRARSRPRPGSAASSEMPSPRTMWSASIMCLDAGNRGDVAADDDRRVRRELAHHAAHLAHLADVHDDRGDADDVVLMRVSSRAKASRVGKSSTVQGAEIFSWIIMMPQERWNMRSEKAALRARHLVVIELHRIDGAAAEFVVLRVRPKDGGQQDARALALGMGSGNWSCFREEQGFPLLLIIHSPHMPLCHRRCWRAFATTLPQKTQKDYKAKTLRTEPELEGPGNLKYRGF